MTSAAITPTTRQKSKPEYYIYYDEWSGEIISVGHSLVDDTPDILYIISNDDSASKILNGSVNDRDYRVALNDDDEYVLMEKDSTLRLRKREEELFEIPNYKLEIWDIRIKIYAVNDIMTVEINQNSLRRLASYKMRHDIIVGSSEKLNIYVTKQNQPDFLISTLRLDPKKLLTSGMLVFDISNLKQYANHEKMGLLTRRQFKNYYFEVLNEKFISSTLQKTTYPNSRMNKAIKTTESHLDIVQFKNEIIITNKITEDQFDDIGLYQPTIPIYIIGDTPDQFYTKYDINLAQLRLGYIERFPFDYDLNDVDIVYHNPKLIISKRKI